MIGHIAVCADGSRGSVESIIATRERETWEIRQADGTPTIVDRAEVVAYFDPDCPPVEDWDELADVLPNEQGWEDAREDAAIGAAEGTR